MKKFICIFQILFATLPCSAENYLLNGGQTSKINYKMVQEIVPIVGTKKLILSYVIPQSFTSPSYNQKIINFNLNFTQDPNTTKKNIDKRGNEILTAIWIKPNRPIKTTITFFAQNNTKLQPLETDAPFPLKNLPSDVNIYLASTKQVSASDPQIINKAKQLTSFAMTEFDAVQQILTWIVDQMIYVQRPERFDAMYSFRTGKGNCQNYSHLTASLMRAVGIPVRIINGITLKESCNVKISEGILTMRMAQGRHSWIEVYFPDLGWIPFDPQQMQLFVSNRFIRVEVGLDNNETISDGCIRWTQSRGASGLPQFHEFINAEFVTDNVNLAAEKQWYGPRKMLFSPPVETFFTELPFEQTSTAPSPISYQELKTFSYKEPIVLGNLDFPQNIDFIETRILAQESADSMMVMRKNFLVETSEYVTSNGQKYAQAFILEYPIKLDKISLALHKFGGDGQLWIELLKDDGKGKPGEYKTTSEIIPLDKIKFSTGYSWIDFEFSKETLFLSPGRYWIALGYTGSPVINWFFTYGKPVGPADGTRYNTIFDDTWSRSLTYEFNYRIVGIKSR